MSRCTENRYPECKTCLNREFDPFECETCDDGSNYVDEDGEEDVLSLAELMDLMKEAA